MAKIVFDFDKGTKGTIIFLVSLNFWLKNVLLIFEEQSTFFEALR